MKKFLAIALSILMLVGVMPLSAMAADVDFVFDFVADKTEVKAGDEVTVTLNVTGTADALSAGWQFEL
ncbi:MAG: hypothetical protein J6L89_07115, partial [Clostridia bacterium]|nr:hypothetical protein [Clostridia bacterium]